jgi:hypothetical protein
MRVKLGQLEKVRPRIKATAANFFSPELLPRAMKCDEDVAKLLTLRR